MKTLFLLLTGISVLSVGNKSKAISLNDIQPVAVECPECTKKFNSCSEEITNEYAKVVKEAVEKLKAGSITDIEYTTICFEAGQKMEKADAVCLKEFNKCCLAETKEEMEKNNKEKEEQ